MPIPSVPTQIPCPLCREPLAMYVTTSKRGRHAIGLVCKRSGKHLRGFINDDEFVAATITKIADAAGVPVDEVIPPLPETPTPSQQALQNGSTTPPAPKSTKRSRRGG